MPLTFSARQSEINTCANKVDPDETARLIRIYATCHSVLDFRLKPLFASVDNPSSRMKASTSETQG